MAENKVLVFMLKNIENYNFQSDVAQESSAMSFYHYIITDLNVFHIASSQSIRQVNNAPVTHNAGSVGFSYTHTGPYFAPEHKIRS